MSQEIDYQLEDPQQVTALLEKGCHFKGQLTFEGVAKLSGNFEGEIYTPDTLIINEGAVIHADIEADTVVLSGQLEGNIFARTRVIMNPPAVFRGTVTSPNLRIVEGVVFEGASYMPTEQQQ